MGGRNTSPTGPGRAPAHRSPTPPLAPGVSVRSESYQQSWAAVALTGVIVLGSAVMIYPKQNYSRNRLAEQFVLNVFNELPQNSILITDYWDFYAPTYYMQIEQGTRPDLALVNTNSLKYAWYVTQPTQRYPWLVERCQDILAICTPAQRKVVKGEPFGLHSAVNP